MILVVPGTGSVDLRGWEPGNRGRGFCADCLISVLPVPGTGSCAGVAGPAGDGGSACRSSPWRLRCQVQFKTDPGFAFKIDPSFPGSLLSSDIGRRARAAASPASSASKPHVMAVGPKASSQPGRFWRTPAVDAWMAAASPLPMDRADNASMALSARKTTGAVAVPVFPVQKPPAALREPRAFQQDMVNSASVTSYSRFHENRTSTRHCRDGRLAEGGARRRGLHPDFTGSGTLRARGLAEREGEPVPRLGPRRPSEAVLGPRPASAGGPPDGFDQRGAVGPVAGLPRQGAVVPS